MNGSPEVIRNTYSVCPICLKRVPAQHVLSGKDVFLQKKCPQHGFFSSIIWRSNVCMTDWVGDTPEMKNGENPSCPHSCGLCPDHRQDTCCVLLEVTCRCNLNCKYCFADSRDSSDPAFEQIKDWLQQLAVPGKTLVQLSGGEPTVRDDLHRIVFSAKQAW